MDKNNFVNQVTYEMLNILTGSQVEYLKSLLITKLADVDLVDIKQLPSTECLSNDTVLQNFMWDKISSSKEKSTIVQYIRATKNFLAFTGKNWIDCTKQDIINYLAVRLYKDHISNSYRNTLLIYISQFFKWLYNNDFMEKDITKGIDKAKVEKKEIVYLTEEEVVRCKENLPNNKYKVLWALMIGCGFRVSELCDLKVEDFDYLKKEIKFWAEKTNKFCTTYITPDIEFAVKNFIKDRTEGYLFQSRKNTKPQEETIEKMAKAIGRAGNCSIKTTVHVFRKTFATSMISKGMDITQVSELLQHEDVSTTNKFYVNKTANDTKHMRLKI